MECPCLAKPRLPHLSHGDTGGPISFESHSHEMSRCTCCPRSSRSRNRGSCVLLHEADGAENGENGCYNELQRGPSTVLVVSARGSRRSWLLREAAGNSPTSFPNPLPISHQGRDFRTAAPSCGKGTFLDSSYTCPALTQQAQGPERGDLFFLPLLSLQPSSTQSSEPTGATSRAQLPHGALFPEQKHSRKGGGGA